MPYLVDGHNLIPNIPNLDLSDPEDETKLIRILQHFAAQRRSKIEVYFDRAPDIRARSEEHGLVLAHFIRQDSSADAAIISRLERLGNRAKNWTIVSSDREVLREARSYQARILKSREFATMLLEKTTPAQIPEDDDPDPEVSPQDVDYWLDQFS
jgi:predicted RNA-binding protein with PIN domain